MHCIRSVSGICHRQIYFDRFRLIWPFIPWISILLTYLSLKYFRNFLHKVAKRSFLYPRNLTLKNPNFLSVMYCASIYLNLYIFVVFGYISKMYVSVSDK